MTIKAPGKWRAFVRSAASILGICVCLPHAHADQWPSRPIRFVAQSAAGDPADLRLRDLLKSLTPELGGVSLVTDNKPGAGGVLAHQSVLLAPADGYTVLLANASMTILPNINRSLTYSPLKDFTPVAFSNLAPIGLAVPKNAPGKNLDEWLHWAKEHPRGSLNFGSPGTGSLSHLYGLQLAGDAELKATHIPYKGVTAALLAMMAGDAHFIMLDIYSLRPMLRRGDVRLLAVTGATRTRYLPDVPTFAELGRKDFERVGWTGFYVRAGTPQPVVDRLASAINKVYASPEWERRREEDWSTWQPGVSPAAMARRIRDETEAWGALIRKAGLVSD